MTEIASQLVGPLREALTARSSDRSLNKLTSESSMRVAAQKLEASFLAEMLKHTGVGQMPEAFNGGAGEAAFSDFLVHEYADAISSKGSIGLADQIYRALEQRAQK